MKAFILAYLDPASGTMLVQAIFAVVVAVGVAFRRALLLPLIWISKIGQKNSNK